MVAGPSLPRRVAAWLAPSVALAALAACVAAVYDAGATGGGLARGVVGAGFAIMAAWPAALGLAVTTRAIADVWRPRALVAALTDAGGAAPRLAGWLVGLVAGAALLAVLSHQVVWLFWRATAFKPRTMAVAMGPVMIVVVIAVVLLTRVAAAVLGGAAAALEARLARPSRRSSLALAAAQDSRDGTLRRGRPVLTPRRVLASGAVLAAVAGWAAWRFVIRPRFANVALGGALVPAIAVAVLVVGHLAWPRFATRLRARAVAAAATTLIASALVATALWARASRPTLVLGLWGGDGFAADAIDLFYDLYAIRDDVPSSDLTPAARPGAPHRDIVLITVDTFRPDRLRPYGGALPTPALAALAARGVVFEWAFAPSNVTRRSMPSIATGLAPPRIRGRVAGWALRMDPRHVTLAERLRAGGYHTVGLFCCEGFWERKRRLGLDRGIDDLFLRHDGQALVGAYRARVAARPAAGPPTFTWLHFIELHEWAGGNPDLSPERRRLYDDQLARVDGWIGELVAATAALPPERQPLIIVTGDHSEAFGDHGQPFHSSDLYNSQIRVPLLVAGPGVPPARIAEPVGLADLAPTLLELAGFVAPGFPAMDGRSLAALVTGARHPDPDGGGAYAATIVDRYVPDRRSALVVGRWKLIHQLGRDELYDLRSDSGELRDLAPAKPEALARLKALLEARWAQDRVSPF